MARRAKHDTAPTDGPSHAARIRDVIAESLHGIVGQAQIDEMFSEGGYGTAFVEQLAASYASMSGAERLSAVFPYVELSGEVPENGVYESFPDVVWEASYDPASALFCCSSEFSLEGYEDYRFEISIAKPELCGCYLVSKLSVCGADIYHRAYSEMAGEIVDEYPVIGEDRFSDVLAQVQSEVERTVDGRYDDTVLEGYWEDRAEQEYNSIIELYGLAN